MSTTWRYMAARARRILRGGCVTVLMVNARSWGREGVWDAWRSDAPDLLERLRNARREGWTPLALTQTTFPYPAPYTRG